MKRNSWVSFVCGGLLLIALAAPAMPAAAAGGADAPGFALLERVLSWIDSWAPTGAPGAGMEREAAAGRKDSGPSDAPETTSDYCDACNNDGELSSVVDPDG